MVSPCPLIDSEILFDKRIHLSRQGVVLNQDKRVANGSRHCRVGAGAFQRLDNIHCDENLVFDYEDRAPSERGMFHVGPMRG